MFVCLFVFFFFLFFLFFFFPSVSTSDLLGCFLLFCFSFFFGGDGQIDLCFIIVLLMVHNLLITV